jgi:hypothetical protein
MAITQMMPASRGEIVQKYCENNGRDFWPRRCANLSPIGFWRRRRRGMMFELNWGCCSLVGLFQIHNSEGARMDGALNSPQTTNANIVL